MPKTKFVDHYPVMILLFVCLINYVYGVDRSYEFLINNFINFFIINHRKQYEKKQSDDEKVSQLMRHVANTK